MGDQHERELFDRALAPPVEPYDISKPFDPHELLDGFTVEEREVPVDPDSPLGRAMAEARESWAENGVPDMTDWKVEPIPVTDFGGN